MIKKKIFRIIWLPVLGSLLCLSLYIQPYARDSRNEIPDLSSTGNISVTMRSVQDDEAIPGGSLTIYKIGSYIWLNSQYLIQIEDEFTQRDYFNYLYPESLDAAMAQEYQVMVDERGIEGSTCEIGGNGEVSFTNLNQGLYLLSQKDPPEGYNPINPFFVTIPLYDTVTGSYLYDVDASPKTQKIEPIVELTPLEPAMMNPAELTPAYHNPAELVPAYHNMEELTPADHKMEELIPAYHNMEELAPAYHNPAELTPADHKMEELTPAYHNPAELEPADHNMEELTPAYCNPAELTPADHSIEELTPAFVEPAKLEPAIATPSEATPDETEPEQPPKTISHRNNGGGSGDSISNDFHETEPEEIVDEQWELNPLPETGEGKNVDLSAELFALFGLLLAIVFRMRLKM